MFLLEVSQKEEAYNFKIDMYEIIVEIQSKINDRNQAIEEFIEKLQDYKSSYMHLFNMDFIIKELAVEYIRILECYSNNSTPKSDYKDAFMRLINIFNSEEHKGNLIYHLFNQAIVVERDDMARVINEIIADDLSYIVDNNNMRLIDARFAYNLFGRNIDELDLDLIYSYMKNVGFYKTEDSIKYSIILISIFGTKEYSLRRAFSKKKITNDDVAKSLSFYNSFKNDNPEKYGKFLCSLEFEEINEKRGDCEGYIDSYFIYKNNVYTVNGIYDLYDVLLDQAAFKKQTYYFIEFMKLKEINQFLLPNSIIFQY